MTLFKIIVRAVCAPVFGLVGRKILGSEFLITISKLVSTIKLIWRSFHSF